MLLCYTPIQFHTCVHINNKYNNNNSIPNYELYTILKLDL